ncbi:MAG: copper resistance CopC/CopD family protein [Jatrophihabitantaceae bacterium]
MLLALFGALFGGGLLLATSASAHASVVQSDPADGSRLKSVPQSVSITFDEPVTIGSLGYLKVTDQSGRRVDTGAAFHPGGDASKVANKLRSGLGDGTYTESFRIISADSHPVAGVVRFVVGNGVLSATSVNTSTVNGITSKVFDAARWVSYAGFALLGGAWLLLTVWPEGRDDRRARRVVWTGWLLAALGGLAELVLQGPYAAGLGLSGLTRWPLLDGTLHTDYGQFHSARLLLLGAVAVLLGWALQGVERRRSRVEDAAWPLLVGVAITFSAIGHADTTNPRWLSITADVLHLCAMSAWVGGLVIVVAAVLPRREPAELRAVLPRFSRVAFVSVVTLAITGTYAAWRGIGSLRAILHTDYGLLVSAKVLLFLGLIGVGNLSRVAIQRRLVPMPVAYAMTDADVAEVQEQPALDDVAHERMRRSVLVEIALAALVLVATSILVDQPRGREALATDARRPVAASTGLGGGRTVTVTLDPGVHGLVTASIALSPGVRPQKLTATALQPSRQIGPIPITLSANGTDLYGSSNLNLPVSGTWVFTLVVTTSKFDAVTADVKIHLN